MKTFCYVCHKNKWISILAYTKEKSSNDEEISVKISALNINYLHIIKMKQYQALILRL